MAEVSSTLSGFRARTPFPFGSAAQRTKENGGISPERRATRLVARPVEQAGPRVSAGHASGSAGRPGVRLRRTAPSRFCAGGAANLGRDGAEKVVTPAQCHCRRCASLRTPTHLPFGFVNWPLPSYRFVPLVKDSTGRLKQNSPLPFLLDNAHFAMSGP